MADPIALGLVALGVLLAFVGAAAAVYAVSAVGVLLGAAAGYLLVPVSAVGSTSTEILGLTAATILLGAVLGGYLAYWGLSVALAVISAVVGGFLGWHIVGPWYADGLVGVAVVVACGVAVGAGFGFVATRSALAFVTAFIGAALASRSVTADSFREAAGGGSIDPLLFDLVDPLFLAVFVLGLLTQFGLFKLGYVTRIASALPGAGRWTAAN